MKLTAIIPVRAGSQRVKNKNLKPFAGTTLLEIKIETLKKVQGIDEIIVSSDSDEMLTIAEKHNVSTHKRDEHFASNIVNNSDFMQNLSTFHITDEIESIDIDTEFDFMTAEFVYKRVYGL